MLGDTLFFRWSLNALSVQCSSSWLRYIPWISFFNSWRTWLSIPWHSKYVTFYPSSFWCTKLWCASVPVSHDGSVPFSSSKWVMCTVIDGLLMRFDIRVGKNSCDMQRLSTFMCIVYLTMPPAIALHTIVSVDWWKGFCKAFVALWPRFSSNLVPSVHTIFLMRRSKLVSWTMCKAISVLAYLQCAVASHPRLPLGTFGFQRSPLKQRSKHLKKTIWKGYSK